MTVAIPVSIARPLRELKRRFRLSGVVIRISGGRRTIWRRSSAGVSPLLVRTQISGKGSPAALKKPFSSSRGVIRFRRMSLFRAFSGET
jgi:hypothetical protein